MQAKLVLFILMIALSFAISYWKADSVAFSTFQESDHSTQADFHTLVKKNVIAHLSAQHRLETDFKQVFLMRMNSLLTKNYLVFFSAYQNGKNTERDVYMFQISVGENAIPFALSPPRNLTLNPNSEDVLYAVDSSEDDSQQVARMIYGQTDQKGDCRSVTFLNWSKEKSQKETSLERLQETHYYDLWFSPQTISVRFKNPLPNCGAKFVETMAKNPNQNKQFWISSNQEDLFKVDAQTQSIHPSGNGVELISTNHESQTFIESIQNTLLTYQLITEDESLTLTEIKADLKTAFDQTLFEFFVDPKDPNFRPVSEVSSILDAKTASWHPPQIDVKQGYPNEGKWLPVKLSKDDNAEKDAYLLKNFIRLDPQKPQLTIHLYAFDMRRLGLHFVGGGDPKNLALEGIGSGKVQRQHQTKVIAAFNGASQAVKTGIIQEKQVLATPKQGLGSILMDDKGRSVLGVLDVDFDKIYPEWTSLRQTYPPITDLRLQVDSDIPPQSPHGRLDDLYLTRSALGVTPKGTLIYVWSSSATVKQIDKALKLVGAHFALSLATDEQQVGLALYPEGNVPQKAYKAMDIQPKNWLEGVAKDFFYLVKSQSLPSEFPTKEPTWQANEGVWQTIPFQDIDPWLATSYLSEKSMGGTQVSMLYVDGERLQPHLALGAIHGKEFEKEISLPDMPMVRIPLGLIVNPTVPTTSNDPKAIVNLQTYGFIHQNKTFAPSVEKEMTFVMNPQGYHQLGRWVDGSIVKGVDQIQTLIQGQALVEGGQSLLSTPQITNEPVIALGRMLNGDLIFASIEQGDLQALAKALVLSGTENALLLSKQGSSEVGRNQYFYRYLGKVYYANLPEKVLKPALIESDQSVLLSFEDALIFTQNQPEPRARFVDSFESLKAK